MSDTIHLHETDAQLEARAQERLAKHREVALLAALLGQLRERALPWWSPSVLREVWPTAVRFGWFEKRPDLRARLTTDLTGLPRMAAREADRGFQAMLVDRVLQSGDIDVDRWEQAYAPAEIAVHAPPTAVWAEFRARFPWESPSAADKELLVWLIGDLLEERKEGNRTASIMTPLYVRSAIDVRVWQESIPLEIRVQVDGRRLRKELEGKGFTCRDELAVVKIERIVEHIPAVHLKGILDALERVLPALASPNAEAPTGDEEPEHTESIPRVDEIGT